MPLPIAHAPRPPCVIRARDEEERASHRRGRLRLARLTRRGSDTLERSAHDDGRPAPCGGHRHLPHRESHGGNNFEEFCVLLRCCRKNTFRRSSSKRWMHRINQSRMLSSHRGMRTGAPRGTGAAPVPRQRVVVQRVPAPAAVVAPAAPAVAEDSPLIANMQYHNAAFKGVDTEAKFMGLLQKVVDSGKAPPKLMPLWQDFFSNYKKAIIGSAQAGANEKLVAQVRAAGPCRSQRGGRILRARAQGPIRQARTTHWAVLLSARTTVGRRASHASTAHATF
jgi:hypothetical protein